MSSVLTRTLFTRLSLPRGRCASSFTSVNFEDHVESFQHKSTWEIVRALVVLRMSSVDAFADNGLKLMQWCRFLNPVLRPILYDQFVGGETSEELKNCMKRVEKAGMRCLIGATLEEDVGEKRNEEVYDKNCNRILSSIKMAAEEGNPSPMVQLKISGLLSADLLVSLGEIYSEKENKSKVIEKIAQGIAGTSELVNFDLSNQDNESLQRVIGRLKQIGLEAKSREVKILIDAEQTHLNPGLSALALGAAVVFNSKTPIFWNTYQCYLKNARAKVDEEMKTLKSSFQVSFGAKVVRGAYMLQERKRAQRLQIADPICSDYKATSANFDGTVSYLLEQTGNDCQLMIASHNEQSILFTINRMEELKIDRRFVSFGQLYGMCDQVSNPLVKAGYAVYKCIPYGSMEEVLPYLARRAAENKCVLQGTRKEHLLLSKELRRRILRKS